MLKQKIKTIFEALLYIMLTYWLIDSFFAFNKYDWMLESGGNICSIPSVSGEDRILQAMIAAFFLLTPLIILILRKLFMREMFEGRCEQVPDMRSCLSSGAMEQGSS
ncbi:hypothetical protein TUM9812_07570 [Escherichia coli]|nr:hypothetical protein TUM9812_07570 [Escherichia coli]